MGSETKPEPNSTSKLPLFSIPTMLSPEPSGSLTPPLHTLASVPFRWEEEPGRPRPCTAVISVSDANTTSAPARGLELPPRLFMESKITNTSSPTTVLDGPYLGKPIFSSSSFRSIRSELQGSFDSKSLSLSPGRRNRGRGFFGSWRQRTFKIKGGKKELGGGSSVFSSSMEHEGEGGIGNDNGDESGSGNTRVKMTRRIRRNGSFSSLSHARSHFWAAIYDGFKQVIPGRSKNSKKRGLIF